MRSRGHYCKKNDLRFPLFSEKKRNLTACLNRIIHSWFFTCWKTRKNFEKIEKKAKKAEKSYFWPKKQAIFIIFFENCLPKKIFFKFFFSNLAQFWNEKNFKKIFFPLTTGRNQSRETARQILPRRAARAAPCRAAELFWKDSAAWVHKMLFSYFKIVFNLFI